jgi:hypothetical protein
MEKSAKTCILPHSLELQNEFFDRVDALASGKDDPRR